MLPTPLAEEAMSKSVGFVPALFALECVALLRRPGALVFTPAVRASLLSKSEEYVEIGPSIEHLLARLGPNGSHPDA